MAKEKYIKGKKDEAHHDGKYSNTKWEQEADYHLLAWLSGDLDTCMDNFDDNSTRNNENSTIDRPLSSRHADYKHINYK